MKRIIHTLAQRKFAVLASLAALLGFIAGHAHLDAAGGKSDSEVKVSARATKPDAGGKQVVTVTLDINDGWHIYANPVKNESFLGAQTVVSINGLPPEMVEVRYPAGKVKDGGSEGNYVIYEGKVAIQAAVQRNAADANGLEVKVEFMACNKGTCLAPAKLKFKLP